MRKLLSICLLSAAAALAGSAAQAAPPVAADYYSKPPLLIGATKPAVLLVLSKDIDMYAPAYAAPSDHDGDGRMDVGFNPAVVHVGIFDPYSCYTYNWKADGNNTGREVEKIKDWSQTPDVAARGRFVRLGPAIPDKEDAPGRYPDANRLPKEIRDGYDDSSNGRPGFRAPRSATGICPARHQPSGSAPLDRYGKNMSNAKQENWRMHGSARIWSGNWLNWMTSSRIDVVRQVLYGGKRLVDFPNLTILGAEYIPQNAGVWSYDDFTKYFWLDYNEGAPYYDSSNYTPVNPDRFGGRYRRLHSYGRSGDKLLIIDNMWFMRSREEVTNHEGFRSFSAYYPAKRRVQYTPLVYLMISYGDSAAASYFEVRVEACRKLTRQEVFDFYNHLDFRRGLTGFEKPRRADDVAEEDLLEAGGYCRDYNGYHKPSGLIQRHSGNGQAMFGLLTGAFNDANRWDGGWIRRNVEPIGDQIDFDGTFKGDSRNNIFKMLDAIGQVTRPRLPPLKDDRTGYDDKLLGRGYGWDDPLEGNFGNPLGEMLYQGLLYFARNSKSAWSVWPGSGLMENREPVVALPRLGASGFEPWKSPLFTGSGDCLTPVMLVLSSALASHDGDMLPGSPHGLRDGAPPPPALTLNFAHGRSFQNAAGLQKTFSVKAYLDKMTGIENLAGRSFYIANLNTGAPGAKTIGGVSRQEPDPADENLCVPRALTSLADVRGQCPHAPQTYGTWSAAAVAWYGNTHDFDGRGAKVQTFAVVLPSIFPRINLESRGKTISVSPVAMSVQYPCGRNDGDPRFCLNGDKTPRGIRRVGPLTSNIIQWRADDAGRVYSGAVYAGFTGRLEGEGADYQVEAPVRYYFDLIRECRPGECHPFGNAPLRESFRYERRHGGKEGYPSRDDERDITYVYFHQPWIEHRQLTGSKPLPRKYAAFNPDVWNKEINNRESSEGRCDNDRRRDMVGGCGSALERQVAVAIIEGYFKDGRYAAAPFKRRREWVYKSWDHAGRPNYIFSSERPKNFRIATYMPKRWSQLPAYFHRPTGLLTSASDPDPALMQSYARAVYPEFGKVYEEAGVKARQEVMRRLPGAERFNDRTSNWIIALDNGWPIIDYVLDETESLFIDRPFTSLGYEEVMDVYGQIGDPYRIYKKVTRPEEIDEAVGVAVFVYSLEEKMDHPEARAPMNIGYHLRGGVNYGESKAANPRRTLGDAEGVYLEIQNEDNFMGGSPQKVIGEDGRLTLTTGEQFGLMTIAHPHNTPPTCYRAGTVDFEPENFAAAEFDPRLFANGVVGGAAMPGFHLDTHKTAHSPAVGTCGSARLPLTATRFFRFPQTPVAPAAYLPDPLYLAAKYGGFEDLNRDGIPQRSEWDALPAPNGDGVPDNYFYAANLSELKDRLEEAFNRIMSQTSVGTATSASVNSVLGGGLTVRTYYQPVFAPVRAPGYPEVKWLGGAYALFIDPWGNMREDTNGNGRLDLECGFAGDPGSGRGPGAKGDWVVQFVDCARLPDKAESLACARIRDRSDLRVMARLVPDGDGRNLLDPLRSRLTPMEEVLTVWDLGRNLSKLRTPADVTTPRASYGDLDSPRRRIYFHAGDSVPSGGRPLGQKDLFSPSQAGALRRALRAGSDSESAEIIRYVMGLDRPGMRRRTTRSPWADAQRGQEVTCRLGDVVNSQPIIVGAPFSNYDYLFADASYSEYRKLRSRRRHLALVGANDGMLHAVNMGFPLSLKGGRTGYGDVNRGRLGRELWAFIPKSLLPHLRWLAEKDYAHSWYVDLTPTVVEVKDRRGTAARGGPWRTIIIASLRFGGRAIEVSRRPPEYSWSEVFALDVTDPDKEPVLLWRFSDPRMGLVVARPTVVRGGASDDDWQVLVGSGPTYDDYDPKAGIVRPGPDGKIAYEGHSNQSAKLFVFDAIRGPDAGVTTLETGWPKSFVSNLHVMAAANSTIRRTPDGGVSWRNTTAYLSVTRSAPDTEPLCLENAGQSGAYLDWRNPADRCPSGDRFGHGGAVDQGGIFRLAMSGAPSTWQGGLKLFFDAGRPVTAAVNTTFDARGNLWVLFGTGRFWADEDAAPCLSVGDDRECALNHVNYLYGLKDPLDPATGLPTQARVEERSLVDVSNALVYKDGSVAELGADGGAKDLVVGGRTLAAYRELADAIADDSSAGWRRALKTSGGGRIGSDTSLPPPPAKGTADWWRGLRYETVLDQVAVAPWSRRQSLMSLATFMPEAATCGSAGKSYGLLLDTFTGLPRPEFGNDSFRGANQFQDPAEDSSPPRGDEKPLSDHVSWVEGKSAAAVFVMTGANESKRGQFEIVNSDGTTTVFKIPDEDMPRGGVLSWREILDMGLMYQ